jgi:hypothetical protein
MFPFLALCRNLHERTFSILTVEFNYILAKEYYIIMSSIGLDILSIGSSKWTEQIDMNLDSGASEMAPSQFMLPAVANVRKISLSLFMLNLS